MAPSIVGQYGLKITMAQIYEALQKAGFAEVVEVGVGADITSVKEAEGISGEGSCQAGLYDQLLLPCLR